MVLVNQSKASGVAVEADAANGVNFHGAVGSSLLKLFQSPGKLIDPATAAYPSEDIIQRG